MYVQCDAKQLEWRTAVELSQDETGIKELSDPTIDIHANNQVELVLPSRLIAKIFLFRTIFRGSGWSFAHDPAFTHVSDSAKYWDDRNERFYKKYNGLDVQHKKWAQAVLNRLPIVGPTGREWFVPVITKNGEPKIPWTQLSNYPVQGTGGDIMVIARISLRNRLLKYKMDEVKLVSTVHDSIVADCPEAQAKDVATIMHEVFNDIPDNFKRMFKYEMKVKFPCDTKQGPNLLDMTELTVV